MFVIIPFCSKDQDQAIRLMKWITKLGTVENHNCVLLPDPTIGGETLDLITAYNPFRTLQIVKVPHLVYGWPQGPNVMFAYWCRYNAHKIKRDFLWLEPDAIPLKKNWLNDLEAEYRACGKKFLGNIVGYTWPDGRHSQHTNGVAIYPFDMGRHAPLALQCKDIAWDVAASTEIRPHTHDTNLIQHEWRPESFVVDADLERLKSSAVLFHQCKDGSLIRLLDKKISRSERPRKPNK